MFTAIVFEITCAAIAALVLLTPLITND